MLAGDEKETAKSRQSLAELSATAVARQIEAEKSLIALGKLESFSQKVAPILAKRCLACHDAKTAKGRFNVETFASLMRGGESGLEIVAGQKRRIEPRESDRRRHDAAGRRSALERRRSPSSANGSTRGRRSMRG